MTLTFFAAIPFETGERYAYGEHITVPLWAAVGAVLGLGLMIWQIRKAQREKRERKSKR